MSRRTITVGVLALQGAFHEHIELLKQASAAVGRGDDSIQWRFFEVRTPSELDKCDALIIPGGESTTMALVASRSGLLEPLRHFVKVLRKPTWGTCAGLILLAESANRTKKGGQDLIGGLDVRVNRNHFGRQIESFETGLNLPFLRAETGKEDPRPFQGIFIRAPVVEKLLPTLAGEQVEEGEREDTVIAPSRAPAGGKAAEMAVNQPVEIMGTLPSRTGKTSDAPREVREEGTAEARDIIAVRQGNCFGTSFHPELTSDPRIHAWWLQSILRALESRQTE